jgi:glycosyltransferase involved in cell wall biosynthesis
MPLINESMLGYDGVDAAVIIPTFNAATSVSETLSSIAESIHQDRQRHRVGISVCDDASTDETTDIVRSFAETSDISVRLVVNPQNAGRAASRNRAIAALPARWLFFCDHDDTYCAAHIAVCLDALAEDKRIDFVETGVRFTQPVHPDWDQRISASLTQNLCVRAYCHQLIGGFHEEPEVELYGCDDILFNRPLKYFFRGTRLAERTVTFHHRPGNSLERQYQRKLSRPVGEAEVTLSAEQIRLQSAIDRIHHRRVQQVAARIRALMPIRRFARA